MTHGAEPRSLGAMKPWHVLDSSVILERKWLRVRQERIGLPHGGEIDEFHVIEAPDWAAALAITESGHLVVVEQYRHGLGGLSRELPAGVVDAGETPLQAARRELLEATGYQADEWLPLLSTATETSRHTNRGHFFFAKSARRVGEATPGADENIRVVLVSPEELLTSVEAGGIAHGLHVAAILMATRRGYLPG